MARPRSISDEDICQHTRQCILEHGPNTPLSTVAESLGVSSPALLKRFGSKEALWLAALKPEEKPSWIVALEQGPTDAPLDVQLKEIGMLVSEFFGRVLPLVMALKACGFDPQAMFNTYKTPPPLRALLAMSQWFKRAQKMQLVGPGDPISMATMFLGSLHMREFMKAMVTGFPKKPTPKKHLEFVAQTLSYAYAPR